MAVMAAEGRASGGGGGALEAERPATAAIAAASFPLSLTARSWEEMGNGVVAVVVGLWQR